ncbi:MAG: hypothetical protein OEZ01_08460 [Candidatus Heimdallarchaeota archaeon]|nr:hypothetical protein [Candidatus Heimdallarchaeota archaeon]
MPSEATCLQLKLEQHFIANNNLSIATITTEEQRVMRQFFHNALKKQADLSPENITPEQEASLMRLLPQEQARAPVKKAEFAGRPKLAARRRLPKSAPLQDAKASSVGANRHKANDSSSIVNPY